RDESCEPRLQVSARSAFLVRVEGTEHPSEGETSMFRKSVLSLAAALALTTPLLLLPNQARADHGRVEHHDRRDLVEFAELRRVVWQSQGGSFKDAGADGWVESNASGTYHFREVRRTREYVDLYDASRGLTARLYDNAMYLQGGSEYPTFTKFYDGGWTE